jgi:hypothetical protein
MASQADPKIRTLIKRCRNNGILEYWNDDILLKTHYSSIPKALLFAKPLAMIPHAHLENGFWTDVKLYI